MNACLRYFKWAFAVTLAGLVGSFWLGWSYLGTIEGALSFLFVGTVLAVLEISLSFDNAIVNANKLKDMTPAWQRRFLTWGILIAVFGMRIVFPLAVVSLAAAIGPVEAVRLAAAEPHTYARIMNDAHVPIAAFGGSFLLMVALEFFLDDEKDVDWIGPLERRMRHYSHHSWLPLAIAVLAVGAVTLIVDADQRERFLSAAVAGLGCFIVVSVAGRALDRWASSSAGSGVAAGGLGAFLYLEMLDASFSFDGVIGAFALTQNLFLIAIGLGIGAMYVRSMTLMIVEQQTLANFRFLEHGAFWSILALAGAMFLQCFFHVPEFVTGLIGAVLIATSLISSILFNRAAG